MFIHLLLLQSTKYSIFFFLMKEFLNSVYWERDGKSKEQMWNLGGGGGNLNVVLKRNGNLLKHEIFLPLKNDNNNQGKLIHE